MAVNERDGEGNVSITAGLVLNELHMYLLSLLGRACARACMRVCVFMQECARMLVAVLHVLKPCRVWIIEKKESTSI